jgi:hypothetical protein
MGRRGLEGARNYLNLPPHLRFMKELLGKRLTKGSPASGTEASFA